MELETIISIITSVLTIISAIVGYYFKVKAMVTEKASEFIDNAESIEELGEDKMRLVVNELYLLIPSAYKLIFTRDRLEKIVQTIFDCIESYASKQK